MRPSRLLIALLVGVLLVAIAGCGGASDEGPSTASASVAKQRALDRKLNRLQRKLRASRAALRARRVREARQAKHQDAVATATKSTAQASGFAALEAELGGQIGAAIGPPGTASAQTFGSLESGSAWSTSKVPIALRLLQDVGGPSGLSSVQADEMRRALILSDNEAAAPCSPTWNARTVGSAAPRPPSAKSFAKPATARRRSPPKGATGSPPTGRRSGPWPTRSSL